MISVVINTTSGFLYFGERIKAKVLLGIGVTIAGIVLISLAKGQRVTVAAGET
jgi:multidrug transporter EmrE-like cation transporter